MFVGGLERKRSDVFFFVGMSYECNVPYFECDGEYD